MGCSTGLIGSPRDRGLWQSVQGIYDADTVIIPHYPNWDGWFNKP